MYNKLFTKILDSSIWLEPTPTRIVWLTFIAVMDENGFAQFASAANVAHRAIVTLDEAQAAINLLENPDPNSSDPENEGKRVQRVPGGWMVLNAEKHRELVTRSVIKEQTRERVKRFRERLKRNSNAEVTTSEAEARSEARSETEALERKASSSADADCAPFREDDFEVFRTQYPPSRRVGGKSGQRAFENAMNTLMKTHGRNGTRLQVMLTALAQHKRSEQWQTPKLIPLMTTWLNQERWNQTLPETTRISSAGLSTQSAGERVKAAIRERGRA